MKKRTIPFLIAILSLCLLFSACTSASAAAGMATEPTDAVTIPKDWEPTMEVESFHQNGATILLQSSQETAIVLCGNDYVLETYTENGWQPLPVLEENVTWVKDAFVVHAAPREKIDWQWLYGSLASGYYRIGKPVTLHIDGKNVDSATVYGEFLLKVPEAEENVYDASKDLPAGEVYSYAPLEGLSGSYNASQAAEDHVVIMKDGKDLENQHIWSNFLTNTAAGQPSTVRCMVIDSHLNTQSIYDVTYDGFLYTFRWMEKGSMQTMTFKHLLRYQGDSYGNPNAVNRYVLTSEKNATWEDIQWGMVSKNPNDVIPHKVVYQELTYHPAHPPVPDSDKVSLSLRGKELIPVTGEKAHQLVSLIENAAVLAQRPNMLYTGLDLIFHGTDGSQVTLWLDLYGDHFLYDGSFYSYSTQKLFDILGIETWPDDVLFTLPEDLHSH